MQSARAMMRTCRTAVDVGRHLIGWHESEAKLTRDAQAYWDAPPPGQRETFAHWRDGFGEDGTWQSIGRENLAALDRLAPAAGFDGKLRRVVEWGCGGGANAVHFGTRCDTFYGVDITSHTLAECDRQMTAAGLGSKFHGVQIDAATPESALDAIDGGCDAFVSFYVFELFPTPKYGERILKIARRLLRPGGIALIHVKYETGLATRSRRWGYKLGVASMTSYRIDEFWQLAATCGLAPQAVALVPRQPLVGDERYAYFALRAT